MLITLSLAKKGWVNTTRASEGLIARVGDEAYQGTL